MIHKKTEILQTHTGNLQSTDMILLRNMKHHSWQTCKLCFHQVTNRSKKKHIQILCHDLSTETTLPESSRRPTAKWTTPLPRRALQVPRSVSLSSSPPSCSMLRNAHNKSTWMVPRSTLLVPRSIKLCPIQVGQTALERLGSKTKVEH